MLSHADRKQAYNSLIQWSEVRTMTLEALVEEIWSLSVEQRKLLIAAIVDTLTEPNPPPPQRSTQDQLAEQMGLVPGAVYEITSPYDSFEAAAVLQDMLDKKKQSKLNGWRFARAIAKLYSASSVKTPNGISKPYELMVLIEASSSLGCVNTSIPSSTLWSVTRIPKALFSCRNVRSLSAPLLGSSERMVYLASIRTLLRSLCCLIPICALTIQFNGKPL